MKKLWKNGRQETGYLKLKIFSFWRFDCYIIKYPTGSFIPEHTDPVSDFNHHRFNFIIKRSLQGGDLFLNNKFIKNRMIYFRPDITKHEVKPIIQGTRYIFSLGWITKK